jgi:cysteine desulfurase/selenocysteine lyase
MKNCQVGMFKLPGITFDKKQLNPELIQEISSQQITEDASTLITGTTNEALDFVNEIGKENIADHENALLKHCVDGLEQINKSINQQIIQLVGTAKQKVSVQSFVINGMHHFDAGMMLDAKGIAVRTGHHCTQPLMNRLGLDGTIRASFSVYNTLEEVDVFLEAVQRLVKLSNK